MGVLSDNVIIGASNASGYDIDNSLRFNAGDAPSLYRDITSTTTSSNFTFSCWFKSMGVNSGPDASTQVPYRTLYASGNTDAWTTIGLASNSGVTDTDDLCIRYGDMDTAAAMTMRGFSNNLIMVINLDESISQNKIHNKQNARRSE